VKVCPVWAVPASIVLAEMSAASANPAAIILPRPRAEFALLNWIISYFPCVRGDGDAWPFPVRDRHETASLGDDPLKNLLSTAAHPMATPRSFVAWPGRAAGSSRTNAKPPGTRTTRGRASRRGAASGPLEGR
jgi:hypothetical protein